ncbi:MAG: hypothetical protein ACPGWR_09215 [Ardenticatenaceae bacterium]
MRVLPTHEEIREQRRDACSTSQMKRSFAQRAEGCVFYLPNEQAH